MSGGMCTGMAVGGCASWKGHYGWWLLTLICGGIFKSSVAGVPPGLMSHLMCLPLPSLNLLCYKGLVGCDTVLDVVRFD
eukprot:scaffold10962_cov19-Tisochrysis_lutea.AAC.2